MHHLVVVASYVKLADLFFEILYDENVCLFPHFQASFYIQNFETLWPFASKILLLYSDSHDFGDSNPIFSPFKIVCTCSELDYFVELSSAPFSCSIL